MVVKAWSQVGSGGRKPEVLVKLVVGECNSRDRVRKSRPMSMKVPEALLVKLLEYARPQGRARKRVKRKGRGCKEKRKAARTEKRRNTGKLSPAVFCLNLTVHGSEAPIFRTSAHQENTDPRPRP